MNGYPPRRQRGQILVLFVLSLVVILAVAGLVLEGGNAFAQQRVAQNGADSAANAGAVVIAEAIGGAVRTDTDVANAVAAGAAQTASSGGDDLQTVTAVYTDGFGVPLGIAVGSIGGGAIPGAARGVNVVGSRPVESLFGLGALTAAAQATAVTGQIVGPCPIDGDCGILPVTPPVSPVDTVCDEDAQSLGVDPVALNWTVLTGSPPYDNGDMSIVPLCVTGSGDFSWLDLGPANLQQEILDPSGLTFWLPDWLQTQTGNPNSAEDEINTYRNSFVLIPMWDGICRIDPGGGGAPNVPTNPCPAGDQVPAGNNTWYHIPHMRSFYLYEAYIQGNNTAECTSGPGSPTLPSGVPGLVGCLKGWWIDPYVTGGPIQIGNDVIPEGVPLGVQLIK
jgi:hypothetical protein